MTLHKSPIPSEKVWLSIAIPTFNRSRSVAATLDAIASQLRAETELSIDIVVSDNCSSDGTGECVTEWINAHPNIRIRYFRNEKNIGFDGNCNLAVQRAAGTFVWLMSDDDFLESGAISRVYSLLRKNDGVSFAFVNYAIVGSDGEEQSRCATSAVMKVAGGDLMLATRFAFSLVSSCVFRRDRWLAGTPDRYLGSGWIHLFMTRDLLVSSDGLLIGEKLIRMNGVGLIESRKQARAQHFRIEAYISAHLKFVEFVYSLRKVGYPMRVVRKAIDIAWKVNLRQIVYYKSTAETYHVPELIHIFRTMASYFRCKATFWVIHVPVLFMPNVVVARLYFRLRPLYKKAKHHLQHTLVGGPRFP